MADTLMTQDDEIRRLRNYAARIRKQEEGSYMAMLLSDGLLDWFERQAQQDLSTGIYELMCHYRSGKQEWEARARAAQTSFDQRLDASVAASMEPLAGQAGRLSERISELEQAEATLQGKLKIRLEQLGTLRSEFNRVKDDAEDWRRRHDEIADDNRRLEGKATNRKIDILELKAASFDLYLKLVAANKVEDRLRDNHLEEVHQLLDTCEAQSREIQELKQKLDVMAGAVLPGWGEPCSKEEGG